MCILALVLSDLCFTQGQWWVSVLTTSPVSLSEVLQNPNPYCLIPDPKATCLSELPSSSLTGTSQVSSPGQSHAKDRQLTSSMPASHHNWVLNSNCLFQAILAPAVAWKVVCSVLWSSSFVWFLCVNSGWSEVTVIPSAHRENMSWIHLLKEDLKSCVS